MEIYERSRNSYLNMITYFVLINSILWINIEIRNLFFYVLALLINVILVVILVLKILKKDLISFNDEIIILKKMFRSTSLKRDDVTRGYTGYGGYIFFECLNGQRIGLDASDISSGLRERIVKRLMNID